MTAPRRLSFYALRCAFVAALFGLLLSCWQILVGSQRMENPGDLARFGGVVFHILATVQLAVAVPFAALLSAAAVSLEKDRKTLLLLLMTRLTSAELVLGKLLASLLIVLVVLVAALPLFMMTALLGGISYGQILRVFGVTVMATLAAGSLGCLVAFWREKTFQALAVTLLILVLWLLAWEVVATGAVGQTMFGYSVRSWALAMSPWQAIQTAARPQWGDAIAGWFPG